MNIFVTFLKLLKVKHTQDFSEKYFNEHPYKYNLYGLSSMLSDYGIENTGLKLDDKQNNLLLLNTPFIASVGNDFVIVCKNTPEKIEYRWKNKKVLVSVDDFIKSWSGVVLLAEPDAISGEPDYKIHRQKELFKLLGKCLLLLLSCLCISMLFASQQLFHNWKFSFLLFINLTGIYVCYLLLLKQMKIQGSYADKICSLFKQGDCNDILESDAAKLGGIIGWSEIGLGYFISNTIVLLCFPFLVSLLAIFNICTLPYSFWSIRYQQKTKHWCPLCLSVQGLLWGIFAINLFAGLIQLPVLSITNLLWVSVIYLIPTLSIWLALPQLSESAQTEDIKQKINSLKANKDVFLAVLKKQPYYEINRENSTILFGNPESKFRITVLTNPHCIPCAKLHAGIEKLLVDTKNRICVQYIFASFNEELESSSRFLVHVYNDYPNQALQIYSEWFAGEKFRREEIFAKYNFDRDKYDQEHILHKAWREKYQFTTTPIVLINGYRLPEIYRIEELRFMTEFNVNIE